MTVELTEEVFRRHLKTKFRVADAESPLELELRAVEGRQSGPGEQGGMERFSLIFHGPGDLFLPQRIYKLEHDEMGEIQIFIVPIGQDADGFEYESVFNYFK